MSPRDATTNAVLELADHLVSERIEKVTLESAPGCWRIWFYLLEAAGLAVQLVCAQDLRRAPGRPKADKIDCVWQATCAEKGLLRPSFVPPAEIRVLRDYPRMRIGLTRERTRYYSRLEKLLEDALIKVSAVASSIDTLPVRDMVEALIAGERDPAALAGLAKGKLRPKIPELTAALHGRFGAHHAIAAARILAHLDFLDQTIAVLDAQVAARVADRYLSAARLLAGVPGLERRSIEVIIAETGADMSCFPSPAHLASWAGLCPGNHESAGKRRKVATTPGNPWLRRTMIESARAAARTRDTYFGAQYRQIARRRGPNKAAVAVAHSLLDVIWHMLTTGEVFNDLGADYFTARHDTEHQARRLVSQLEKLGYTVQVAAPA